MGETREDILPATLAFVAVRELDVRVLERELVFGEFFEADDYVVLRSVDPGAFGDEGCADGGEFGVLEDAFGGVLDIDLVACIEELLCGGGSDCESVSGVVWGVGRGSELRAERCSRGLLSERRWRVVTMAVCRNA